MENIKLLKHLQFLTGSFNFNSQEINYISVYSKRVDGIYKPTFAENEGIACVDDAARAIIFALEIYEYFGEKQALEWALKWLPFLEYMQDIDGYITNFISNKDGGKVYGIPSSYGGGAWWSARTKWAWAKAYKLTGDRKYLDLYFKTKIVEKYKNDVAGVLLLAGLEILEEEDPEYINGLAHKIFSLQSQEGFLIHAREGDLHLWGYHELEALAKASYLLTDQKLLSACEKTIDLVVKKVVNDGFYFEFFEKNKSEINPYCVSPLVRGLYEVYQLDKKTKHLILMKKCFEWIDKLYDPESGRCCDWVSSDKITTDSGAEASIEAGFCWLRRLKLGI